MTNKEFFIQTWQSEMKSTLSAVKGLPTDMSKLSYQCDQKARTAEAILGHMLSHAEAINLATDSFIATEIAGKTFKSIDEAAAYFEKNAQAVVEKLKKVDDKTWSDQIVEFHLDGNKLFEYPMMNMFWTIMFDMIHHRGQLSTYYRHMGVRNPQIYGPTAEDMEAMMAAAQN